jgi:hypothetical protein
VVAHQRQRLAVRAAQPLERVDLGALGQAQVQRDGPGGGQAAEADHGGGRVPAGLGQVVVQAGELDLAADLGVHDLGADAAFADQQAAVHQVADGLAHRGAGQAEPVGQVDLVLQPGPGGQLTGLNELLEMLGDLEIERDRAGPVHPDGHVVVHGTLPSGHREVTPSITPISLPDNRCRRKYVRTNS